jgi:hypothetical protein
MKNLLLLLIISIPCLLSAQFGLHASYQKNTQVSQFPSDDFPISGLSFGVDYTFRLAQNRVEFFPELNFNSVKTSSSINTQNGTTSLLEDKAFGFYFNTNVYIFDFEGDCDCPVFSKDGNFLKKGFFIQLSPGVNYHNYVHEETSLIDEINTIKDDDFSFSLAAGAGIDIGLSEHLTISPYFRARYHFETEIEGYVGEASIPEVSDNFPMWQMNAGLRLGFQLTDEFTRNKRMRARRESKRIKKSKKRRY